MLSVGITEIWDIAFSPDGDLLAVAGTGEKIVFINVPERRLAFQLLTSHTNRINTLAFSPDGHILASGGADNLVRLWDVTTQKSSGLPLQMHSDQVYGLAFSPDGRLLASSDLAGKILLTTVRYESVEESICMMVARNLTPIEWQQYIGDGNSYHKICPDLP
jgi:WD40 repeat protein